MAKETKVGLLAGLAFIICFAVILTNRGREDLFTPVPVEAQPTARADSSPRQSGDPELVKPTARPYRQSPDSVRQTRGQRNMEQPSPQLAERRGQNPPAASSLSAGTSDPGYDEPPNREALERITAWQREVEQRLNDLSREIEDEPHSPFVNNHATQLAAQEPLAKQTSTSRPEPARLPESAPAAGLKPTRKTYEVAGGDTLTKIAARFYGKSGRTVINAIYDANRSIMSSPDDLRAGVELELPVVQGLAAAAAERSETRRDSTSDRISARGISNERPSSPAGQDFRWYQIQKNDRYVVIARRELGDASRWREIYELNKDKFPDASRIRAGVRIKLPLADARRRGEAP